MHYYNEIEPFSVDWLHNLMDAEAIPQGVIDDRSIEDVEPADLEGFVQCHFFCGIAGWPQALTLAEWPLERRCWTGSCPCQPFSSIGQRQGEKDRRHLWPAFCRLITECQPPTVFGEQVAGPIGREWLAAVRLDLESVGYACGSSDLPAASVGAPHIRQRLYWVAHSPGIHARKRQQSTHDHNDAFAERLVNSLRPGLQRHAGHVVNGYEPGQQYSDQNGHIAKTSLSDHWCDLEWLLCADRKYRPTEPGLCPLVDGFSNRLGQLRAYGNAIVPPLAAAFVQAYRDLDMRIEFD